jgi:hypothetical protein
VLVAVVAGSGALAPRLASAQFVVPLVDYISYDPATDEVTAWLGYRSSADGDRTIPLSANNFFEPPPIDRG